jgi:PTS system nitrogen regulatory IIA component
MSTAINHGIAIPHTRDFLLKSHHDILIVVFLKNPIDWGAMDKKPVHTLFFLFACDDKHHLNLLAKLAHLSSSEDALTKLLETPTKEELLQYVKSWEAGV